MIQECKCYKRRCKYYLGVENPIENPIDEKSDKDYTEEFEYHICAAFNYGIPDDISYGDNDHTKPIKNDNGKQFDKIV